MAIGRGNPPEIRCLNCGRVLAVRDTTPNMQSGIIAGLGSRLFRGERSSEVVRSACEYFAFHAMRLPLARQQRAR